MILLSKRQQIVVNLYFNYKHTYSIIFIALADANYKFTYINVGAPGSDADDGVYLNCALPQVVENNTIKMPHDAFALKSYKYD